MNKVISLLFTYLFPILMLDYYLIVRGINLNTLIVLPIFFILTVLAVRIGFRKGNDSFVKSMNLFLGYSLITAFFYAFNDAPFSCYTSTLRSFVFPIIFAYLGYSYSIDEKFNKYYLFGCAFCFLIGFYLYLEAPPYYVSYMASVRENAFNASSEINETNIMEYSRFSSFFATSYAISCFSIPALILSLSFALTSDSLKKRVLYYIIAFASFIAAFLCQQRIAMGFALLIVICWGLYSRKLTSGIGALGVIIAYIFLFLLSIYILGSITHFEWYERTYDLVTMRIDQMDFSDAMAHRTKQYSSFNRMTDFSLFFGLGLGSCGHAATAVGLKSIADGEFIKLFYEFGVIGCLLLLLVILPTLRRGIMNLKIYYKEVLIIIFYLAAGIGSDSLTFFIYSIMFWYSIGRIWNKSYYRELINNNKTIWYGVK